MEKFTHFISRVTYAQHLEKLSLVNSFGKSGRLSEPSENKNQHMLRQKFYILRCEEMIYFKLERDFD